MKLKDVNFGYADVLNPNCSEYVFRIGIKKSEIPYIKKRIKDLGWEENGGLLEEFEDYIDKPDDLGLGEMMSESYATDYERIRDEVLSKRNHKSCPFCKEVVGDLNKHIREYHKEEIILIYGELTKEDVNRMRKEVVLDNLN